MKKFNFNDYIPEELVDNESCRLITTEQYKEWKASEKKLEIATKALKRAQRIFKRDNVMLHTKFVELQNAVFAANDVVCSALYKIEEEV